ncbi:MAG: NAD(P)H-binding protein [Candidatus Limnocylindrales bacterium]
MPTLRSSQTLPVPRDEVFAFFAQPRNLARITPPGLGFVLRSSDVRMRPGLDIEYRLRPLLGIPVTWRSRIVAYDPPASFVDDQVEGPYRHWSHQHRFIDLGEGTAIDDEVELELPLGIIGGAAFRLSVRSRLEGIFRYRARAVAAILQQARPNPAPRRVAVAGGTGFVGGAVAAELHRRGHEVVVISHRGEDARALLPDAVGIRTADVTTGIGLDDALAGIDDLVIALAFPGSPVESPRQGRTFEAVDANGTERLVMAARASGVRSVRYVSGAGAAPDAERHWFRAKWRAEEAVRTSGLTWTIVRPTWIYGPRDVSLNRFVGFARSLGMVPLTNRGRQLLAPVFVDDIAHLLADTLEGTAAESATLEIGGPETLPMHGIIETALRVAGLRRPIVPGPTALLKAMSAPLTLLPTPPLTPDAIDFINQPATVDTRPLLERMPRRLTPLAEGLATYLAPSAGPGTLDWSTD